MILHTYVRRFVLDTPSYDVTPNTSAIQMPTSAPCSVLSSCRQEPDDGVMAAQLALVLCPSCVPEKPGADQKVYVLP
jgi:hypothetical protein